MKKKVLVSVTIAVMLVAALAVTAFAGVSVSGPGSVEPGETIQVTISGTGEGVNGDISTSGLEYVSHSGGLSAPNAFVLVDSMGGMSVTYTYRVTASSGNVSVSLSNCYEAQGGDAVAISGDSWSASVAGASEPTQQPTQPPTQTPTDEPSPSTSASASASASSSATGTATGSVKPGTSVKPGGTASGNQDKMPKTGDATMDLWVLAAVAAGSVAAAVVAGKKVFAK